jgi:NADH-quinone oxidoreductase subunit L
MEKIVLIIPFIPVIIALYIRFLDKKELMPKISLMFSSIVLVLGLYGSYYVMNTGNEIIGFGGLLVYNELSSILVVYVAILGLVIRRYATKYMWDEAGYKRFFILLNFIFSAIYLLVMSNNLIVLTLGWQLMSISLYLLVSFNVSSNSAVKNGGWTMITHKVADILFIIAIVLTYKTFGSFDLTVLGKLWKATTPDTADPMVYVIGLLFLFAAMMKSAIMPFHHWVPYTSEAPTPVSALMHAGVVNVGAILLNKLAFLIILSPMVLNIAFVMGLFTAIFASILMLVVSDIKRSLGYSTVGQMGYMIMEIGLGAFSLAIYHLMLHGIFKASLFLGSGSVINHARREPNIPRKLTYELFWKEKQNKASKKQMLRYMTIFTIVPILIFIGAKLIIGEDFFQVHAAVIILAFAALTGTQLFLSFLKASKESSPKILLYLISAFAFVILSYEIFGLALEHYLYPIEANLFYEAATKHVTGTMILAILALILMVGWYFMYKKHFFDTPKNPQEPNERKWLFYKILAKEAYFSKFFVKYIKIF